MLGRNEYPNVVHLGVQSIDLGLDLGVQGIDLGLDLGLQGIDLGTVVCRKDHAPQRCADSDHRYDQAFVRHSDPSLLTIPL